MFNFFKRNGYEVGSILLYIPMPKPKEYIKAQELLKFAEKCRDRCDKDGEAAAWKQIAKFAKKCSRKEGRSYKGF